VFIVIAGTDMVVLFTSAGEMLAALVVEFTVIEL